MGENDLLYIVGIGIAVVILLRVFRGGG